MVIVINNNIMKKIESIEELKHIQLDILIAFHQFCIEHNIKYSLAGGTLIGAIRHKGFIPWDDDIDVYLLREDYEKLNAAFPSAFNDKFILVTRERDCKWNRAYGKLYDSRTVMKEHALNTYKQLGVGIDVFPIDDVPDEQSEWDSYNRKRKLLRDIYTIKSLQFSTKRSAEKNVLIFISRILLWPFSFRFLSTMIDKYSQKYNGKGYTHVYENCLGVYNSKYPWKKSDLENVIDTEFEGHTVKIMKGYEDYLTCIYGDYMKLPPVEKRNTHHHFDAFWR